MAKSNFFKNLFRREKKGFGGITITITDDGQASERASGTGASTADAVAVSIPLIGSLAVKTQYWVAGGVMLVSLFLAAASALVLDQQKAYYGDHLYLVGGLRSDLESFRSDTYRVASGLDTFTQQAYLEQKTVEDSFNYMRAPIFGSIKELSGTPRTTLDVAWKEWIALSDARAKLTEMHLAVLTVRSKFATSRVGINSAAEVFSMWSGLPEAMATAQWGRINDGLAQLARIQAHVNSGESNVSYGTSSIEFNEILTHLGLLTSTLNTDSISDAAVKTKINDTLKFLNAFIPSAKKINSSLDGAAAGRAKIALLSSGSGHVLQLVTMAEEDLRAGLLLAGKINWLIALFSILSLGSIVLLVVINNNEGKKRIYGVKNENEANQRAIMSLLDEIANLADGDLTVRATVTEEITGAIADSVNFAISELGTLVSAIKNASSKMSEVSGVAMSNSTHLLDISTKQSKDITETGKSVLHITEAIEQVSKQMADSKKVAESSVESSNRGMKAVENSIDGIRSIRENVDETGKRIKRLTEQSMQISEIVELIGDISERTSVLAINATVEATKAGAAGKGFKVVADAVQDLANQASDATRKIGALINAVQTDIQGAGAAMLKTNAEAVKGADLAEATGAALAEINEVSVALSEIVAEVNEQIGNSARSAAEVSLTMKRVLESVVESADATKTTGEAVGTINQLTDQLRESVSGFKI